MMTRYTLNEAEHIRVLGRTAPGRDPLALFWSGSGLEMAVTGTELRVELTADYDSYEPWIEVIVDGALTQRRMLEKGAQTVTLMRRMDEGPVRRVRLIKGTQAANGDDDSACLIRAVWTDGAFQPLPPVRRRVEVIGDSITSGEGLYGAHAENSWNGGAFGVYGGYAYRLGERLGAEVNLISQSGYGVYCNWCGDPREAIPPYYDKVCGPLHGGKNAALGAFMPWDFTAWPADAVVVNLGTNDAGSFQHAGETFPERAWRDPMRQNADGTPNEDDRRLVLTAAVDFLTALRRLNPSSYILWVYGILPGLMEKTLREAVDTFVRATGDRRVGFELLPPTSPDEFGSRSHPGWPAHEKAAAAIEARLRAELGWAE